MSASLLSLANVKLGSNDDSPKATRDAYFGEVLGSAPPPQMFISFRITHIFLLYVHRKTPLKLYFLEKCLEFYHKSIVNVAIKSIFIGGGGEITCIWAFKGFLYLHIFKRY